MAQKNNDQAWGQVSRGIHQPPGRGCVLSYQQSTMEGKDQESVSKNAQRNQLVSCQNVIPNVFVKDNQEIIRTQLSQEGKVQQRTAKQALNSSSQNTKLPLPGFSPSPPQPQTGIFKRPGSFLTRESILDKASAYQPAQSHFNRSKLTPKTAKHFSKNDQVQDPQYSIRFQAKNQFKELHIPVAQPDFQQYVQKLCKPQLSLTQATTPTGDQLNFKKNISSLDQEGLVPLLAVFDQEKSLKKPQKKQSCDATGQKSQTDKQIQYNQLDFKGCSLQPQVFTKRKLSQAGKPVMGNFEIEKTNYKEYLRPAKNASAKLSAQDLKSVFSEIRYRATQKKPVKQIQNDLSKMTTGYDTASRFIEAQDKCPHSYFQSLQKPQAPSAKGAQSHDWNNLFHKKSLSLDQGCPNNLPNNSTQSQTPELGPRSKKLNQDIHLHKGIKQNFLRKKMPRKKMSSLEQDSKRASKGLLTSLLDCQRVTITPKIASRTIMSKTPILSFKPPFAINQSNTNQAKAFNTNRGKSPKASPKCQNESSPPKTVPQQIISPHSYSLQQHF